MFEEFESILNVEEACEALKIGKNRIYQLLQTGELKGYKEGRHWKITKDELLNYIQRQIKSTFLHLITT